jgi:hypothetical protein
MSGDCTGRVSSKKVTMVSFGVNSIHAKFNTLDSGIGPVENKYLYLQSWNSVEQTFLAAMLDWKCCAMFYAHCTVCPPWRRGI